MSTPEQKEKMRAATRRCRAKHLEAYRERDRIAANKKYYLHNAKVRAGVDKWKAVHKDYMREYMKKYNALPENKAKAKLWRAQNKEKDKLKKFKRRAQKQQCLSDSTAEIFYKFVRNKKLIACYYCGTMIPGKKAHIDHIVAVSKQGNHSSENLCASCPSCNMSKRERSLSEWPRNGQSFLNL